MSGLGFIRLFLLLWWAAWLFACVFLFLFGKRRSAAMAGFMVALGFIGFVLMGSTKAEKETDAIVQKATERIANAEPWVTSLSSDLKRFSSGTSGRDISALRRHLRRVGLVFFRRWTPGPLTFR